MNSPAQSFLAELYSELRWYRSKEYQTFLFTFSIVGIGFNESFRFAHLTTVLISLAMFMLVYIWKNHMRMSRLKKAICQLQIECEISELAMATGINCEKWANKPWYLHLGTMSYSSLLIGEAIALYFTTHGV